ncbi:MAG: BamA/TamA family outer membrane protein [Bacteroides sp.]|nr:BamA/TamA family outer membrane protein [Bacteroides sp.]
MKSAIFSILITLFSVSVICQEADSTQEKISRKEKRAEKVAQGKFMAFPFATPAYTPELGPTLIGAMMISFKTNPADTIIQRSSTPLNIGVSTRGSYFFNSIISTYWFEDKMRIFGELRFRNTPDHYWGVGYENASSHPERDESNAYNRAFWKVNPKILWQFRKDFFLGLNIDYNWTKVSDVNPNMEADPDYLGYGPVNFNSGLGLMLRYDSRDVPVNAWSGTLIDLQVIGYSPALGGNNSFNIVQLDIRKFLRIVRPGSTLALQVKSKITGGSAPYTDLAFLGSPYDLRGYYLGHYRDRSMILGLAEYRFQFMKRDGKLSRHGVVGWIGTGSIAPESFQFSHWLPNAGFGYRFEVQPRMNVRAEFGFGKECQGFYFSFNEAF